MYKLYMLLLLLISTNVIEGQPYVYIGEVGAFNSAYSFSINQAGILFVSDVGSNEIIKLDTLGQIIRVIGGYGWGESSFDFPSDIYANTLNVYIADKNNDRIQIFDKDLNYIWSFSAALVKNEKSTFRFPTSIGVSSQGDIFVLDSDNSRILKFNSRGEFLVEIGGYNSGSYTLRNPKKLDLFQDGKIIVLDPPFLLFFDYFGNNLKKIELDFEAENITSTFQAFTISSHEKVEYVNYNIMNWNIMNIESFIPKIESQIMDALIFNNKLYVLTDKTILIYQVTKRD